MELEKTIPTHVKGTYFTTNFSVRVFTLVCTIFDCALIPFSSAGCNNTERSKAVCLCVCLFTSLAEIRTVTRMRDNRLSSQTINCTSSDDEKVTN